MYVNGFVDFGGDEGAEDVQSIKGHALLGGEGEEEVDCFGVDCGGEYVAEAVGPFLISEYHKSAFVFGGVPHCIEF